MNPGRFNMKRVMECLTILILAMAAHVAFASDQKPREGSLIVNVNDAEFEELESLPCVGKELAKEIFSKRPYKSVDDLIRVKGIGEKNLECIRPYVKVSGETEPRKN
jgi:DNA uptake protein ComE-like DNA-binding protein